MNHGTKLCVIISWKVFMFISSTGLVFLLAFFDYHAFARACFAPEEGTDEKPHISYVGLIYWQCIGFVYVISMVLYITIIIKLNQLPTATYVVSCDINQHIKYIYDIPRTTLTHNMIYSGKQPNFKTQKACCRCNDPVAVPNCWSPSKPCCYQSQNIHFR